MAKFNVRTGVRREIVIVSGVCPTKTNIVVPDSGFSVSLVQLQAANLTGDLNAITLFEGETQLNPQIALGASGTFFWDIPGGEQLELLPSSGLTACLDSTGLVEVAAYYILWDNRPGITKEAARATTYQAGLTSPRAIRRPTRGGDQQEG